jgi:hypothetical protein
MRPSRASRSPSSAPSANVYFHDNTVGPASEFKGCQDVRFDGNHCTDGTPDHSAELRKSPAKNPLPPHRRSLRSEHVSIEARKAFADGTQFQFQGASEEPSLTSGAILRAPLGKRHNSFQMK